MAGVDLSNVYLHMTRCGKREDIEKLSKEEVEYTFSIDPRGSAEPDDEDRDRYTVLAFYEGMSSSALLLRLVLTTREYEGNWTRFVK